MSNNDCQPPQQTQPDRCIKEDQPLPALSSAEAGDVAKDMGMRPCSKGSVEVGNFLAKAHADMSVGCEQATLIARKYRLYQQQVQCILSSSIKCDKVNVQGKNKLVIINTGVIDCPVVINQNIAIKLMSTTRLSDTQKTELAQTSRDFLKSLIKNVQSSTTEGETNPDGEKFVEDSLSDIQSTNFSSQLNESYQNSITEMFGSNDIRIENQGVMKCGPDGNMEITQDVAIDAIIKKMFTNMMELANSQENVSKFFEQVTSEQKQKRKEASGNIIMIIVIIICVGALGSFIYKNRDKFNNPSMRGQLILEIIMFIIVVIIVLYIIKKIGHALNPVNWVKSIF